MAARTGRQGPAETSALREHRDFLIKAEQKAQEDFDRTVFALSAGALGVSFAFVKEVIGANPIKTPLLLIFAWAAWGISLACVLFSYHFSGCALRRAIEQLDEGTIYTTRPGGFSATLTSVLNISGAVLFLLGVALMAAFVKVNLGV